jgi:hypothetical protein
VGLRSGSIAILLRRFEISRECITERGLDQKAAAYERKIAEAMLRLGASYKIRLRLVNNPVEAGYDAANIGDVFTDVVRNEEMRNESFIVNVTTHFLEKQPEILFEASSLHEVCHVMNDDLAGYHRNGANIEAGGTLRSASHRGGALQRISASIRHVPTLGHRNVREGAAKGEGRGARSGTNRERRRGYHRRRIFPNPCRRQGAPSHLQRRITRCHALLRAGQRPARSGEIEGGDQGREADDLLPQPSGGRRQGGDVSQPR